MNRLIVLVLAATAVLGLTAFNLVIDRSLGRLSASWNDDIPGANAIFANEIEVLLPPAPSPRSATTLAMVTITTSHLVCFPFPMGYARIAGLKALHLRFPCVGELRFLDAGGTEHRAREVFFAPAIPDAIVDQIASFWPTQPTR